MADVAEVFIVFSGSYSACGPWLVNPKYVAALARG